MERFKAEFAGYSLLVWAVIGLALMVQLSLVRAVSIWSALTSIITGMFCAFVFTRPLINWMDWGQTDAMIMGVAAASAIFGEKAIVLILKIADLESLIRAWRSK